MGDLAEPYSIADLTGMLREMPETPHHPQIVQDLPLLLRGATPQVIASATVRLFLRAIVTSVDPQRAVNHFLRYTDCLGDVDSLWTALQQHPQAITHLVSVFAASSFLSGILCRRPHLLFWLLEEALLTPSLFPAELQTDLAQLLCPAQTEAEVAAHLRAFTHQHLLRIGARDLNALATVEETTADLSALADSVIQAGLQRCQDWLEAIYGAPVYTDEAGHERPCHFCVIGMGKLGGYELNFSSDIDLMYVYTSYQGQTRGILVHGRRQNQISNHEYFITLARRLTNLIGGKGPEGQAFRVDLRLRPEGTQGQLALSLLSYEAYYARLGQTWEKMALLKARPLAGDRQLGEEFMALVRPFIYQRHLDLDGVRALQAMKHQIDIQIADKDQSRTNVKLGLGGIREIEFFIQILQLLFGGRYPALQERHSLRALQQLGQAGLITSEEQATLEQTYCYLRRLEHRLQMEQGAQTHTLPHSPTQQLRLARLCGYATWNAFYEDYTSRTEVVHALFTSAFQSPHAVVSAALGPHSQQD